MIALSKFANLLKSLRSTPPGRSSDRWAGTAPHPVRAGVVRACSGPDPPPPHGPAGLNPPGAWPALEVPWRQCGSASDAGLRGSALTCGRGSRPGTVRLSADRVSNQCGQDHQDQRILSIPIDNGTDARPEHRDHHSRMNSQTCMWGSYRSLPTLGSSLSRLRDANIEQGFSGWNSEAEPVSSRSISLLQASDHSGPLG